MTDITKLPSPRPAAPQKPADPRIAAKARELEGVLLGQFVQLMFQGIHDGGTLGGGSAEGQWQDLLAQEYGKAIANNGGIGLAVQIERELQAATANGQPRLPATSQGSGTKHDD
ncbi:rod-binding protein [Benzoatithermus flavus]|uniref:Rod-binding protein n=1 Tax=Benzoatithermus flavus TaxID=3108223 RepID=A0ABU8XUX9_9PROT